MKKSFKFTILAIVIAIIAIFAISCGDKENYTSIETPRLEYKDGAYMVNVSSSITTFDLSSLFTISENATFAISKSEAFDSTVENEVTLSDGENVYYVKVKDKNKNEMTYKFVIIKSRLLTVTFNTNGGSEIPPIKCEEGRILEAPVSLKLGYKLAWDYDFNNPITESITINATWTANTYKISIDGTDKVVDVIFNTIPSLTADEKVGYKFNGWQYNGATFDATKPYTIDGDITIKPVYEVQKYTINYITIGGTNTNPTTYTVEDEIIFNALTWTTGADDKLVYEFAGWYKDAEYTVPFEKIEKGTTGAIDVYANWTITAIPEDPIKTIITFKAPDFDCNGQTQDVTVGEQYTLPKLEKNGYIFAGWQSEDGEIIVQTTGTWAYENENIELVPNWTKRTYSITYILNGGTNNKDNVETFSITDTIVLYSPEKQYSSFVGWYSDEAFENKVVEISEGTYDDVILYAKWDEISYNISYDANGGEISQDTQAVVLGGEYTLLEPKKLGYKFDGWYYKETLVEQSGKWMIEENASLVAKWSLESYKLECELDGGTVEGWTDSYTFTTNDITLPIPTKEGKEFLGWSINNGPITKKMVLVKGSIGNRVYIAHWCDSQAENGVVYSINNGVAVVVGYKGVVGKNVTIPSEYNGYKVVAIDNNAFSGYGLELEKLQSSSSFTTLVIPDTITRIGANAFTECDDLKVQLANADDDEINAWAEKIVIESGNDHVLDVIMGKRPAIGWRVYYKPEA